MADSLHGLGERLVPLAALERTKTPVQKQLDANLAKAVLPETGMAGFW